MLNYRPMICNHGRGLHHHGYRQLIVAFTLGVTCLFDANIASAAELSTVQLPVQSFPLAQIFTFLFLMLGPFKVIGPFSKITRGADAGLSRQIAVKATLFSSIALLVAAFLGEYILRSYGIPIPVLALAAGIILFLVALQSSLQQFVMPTPHSEGVDGTPPAMNMALTPLAFPTIVTPYGIAALVVFLALTPSLQSQLILGAIVLVIMLLNLIAMLTARRMGSVVGIALSILGAVLGVVQVALGLQIIHNSLKALGVL